MNTEYRIIESAYKHGVDHDDIDYVYRNSVSGIVLRNDPRKVMLFGWDTAGRALEVGYFYDVDGTRVIMHAKAIRKVYEKYLENWKKYQLFEEVL